uniref:Uncharacterized protein n=1 Tax=Panagrellus redivivus TaxID=6233 RepID=A0A7E4W4W3_PANRE
MCTYHPIGDSDEIQRRQGWDVVFKELPGCSRFCVGDSLLSRRMDWRFGGLLFRLIISGEGIPDKGASEEDVYLIYAV